MGDCKLRGIMLMAHQEARLDDIEAKRGSRPPGQGKY